MWKRFKGRKGKIAVNTEKTEHMPNHYKETYFLTLEVEVGGERKIAYLPLITEGSGHTGCEDVDIRLDCNIKSDD